MRCVSWEAGDLVAGIPVSGTLSKGFYCALGDPQTAGPAARVPFHQNNPPTLENDRLHSAFPFWVRPKDAKRFLVLAAPHEKHADDARTLLRISTYNPETFGGRGFWRVIDGRTNTIATGLTYYTDVRGRAAIASHGLVLLEAGQVLRVRPEGADTHWAVYDLDGTLRSIPWEQYQAALYLETA
jgi:hypothetical protein